MTAPTDVPRWRRRVGRVILWALVRTLTTRADTARNRARCERSRFVWGIPPGKKRIHLRVLGLVNGFLPDDRRLFLFYDPDDTTRVVAADVGDWTPSWGEQL